MRYSFIFNLMLTALFLYGCSKNVDSSSRTGSLTYKVCDRALIPVAGAKVVLIENGQTIPSGGQRKDSGFTNNSGYITFNNLIAGNSYHSLSSLGCLTTFAALVILEFDPSRRDTIHNSILPTGYLKISNSLSTAVSVWSTSYSINLQINPNTTITTKIDTSLNTLNWGRFNPTTSTFEPHLVDTTCLIHCGDTGSFTIHL